MYDNVFYPMRMSTKSEGPVLGMWQLKKFAVVVWVRKTATFKAVREQLVAIAEDEPDGWRTCSGRFQTSPKSSSCVCPVMMTSRPRSR